MVAPAILWDYHVGKEMLIEAIESLNGHGRSHEEGMQ
jgi:hypothetical protein